ncbi:hypothetical protein M431DRAFT_420667 [Trichoderma harzianum CBS 226.95]|uniref:Uncharacterized protein n=1 Tax=Trichoderma harzianum CBS 226.95 TaxID=983964 RepID=A0A2T3ZRJ5_TRIHA|nr:hypothetical protein M431DRAFT_420667 [Trichoderma harzianum CBS 226.95]PTB47401.1 hypothetical protein M431DRAFT_420667 [Trichoderma harzianum CBS 226.95]
MPCSMVCEERSCSSSSCQGHGTRHWSGKKPKWTRRVRRYPDSRPAIDQCDFGPLCPNYGQVKTQDEITRNCIRTTSSGLPSRYAARYKKEYQKTETRFRRPICLMKLGSDR